MKLKDICPVDIWVNFIGQLTYFSHQNTFTTYFVNFCAKNILPSLPYQHCVNFCIKIDFRVFCCYLNFRAKIHLLMFRFSCLNKSNDIWTFTPKNRVYFWIFALKYSLLLFEFSRHFYQLSWKYLEILLFIGEKRDFCQIGLISCSQTSRTELSNCH